MGTRSASLAVAAGVTLLCHMDGDMIQSGPAIVMLLTTSAQLMIIVLFLHVMRGDDYLASTFLL